MGTTLILRCVQKVRYNFYKKLNKNGSVIYSNMLIALFTYLFIYVDDKSR